ncbi:MAG: tetratricopeptide repeat protein [Steroidobacter sp.]
MTVFVIVCAVMVAAALLWLVVPLVRPKSPDAESTHRGERRIASLLVAVLVPALAAVMYAGLSDWDFDAVETQTANSAEVDGLLKQLEAKLKSNPGDIQGWLLLGKSYATTGRFALAVDAFQQAYDLSKGENVEAAIGLGEALAFLDEASLTGRAGQLFDAALAKAPNHPKALWYGSMSALRAGDLRTGRDRLQLLLAQNPPEQLRSVLERQIQDLNQQLGEGGEGVASASPPGNESSPVAAGSRAIRVSVSIAPQIKEQINSALPLFILARDPAGGPPLAVQRHTSAAAPLTIELSERDAMMPTRTIASVPRVQVVARVSKSGAPQAQSGDFYGEAEYDFANGADIVTIVIDRTVP